MAEDQDGFIWISTPNGIQRYDGHGFKSWTKADYGDAVTNIGQMQVDPDGWVWLWNQELCQFNFLNTFTEELISQTDRFGENCALSIAKGLEGHPNQFSLLKDLNGRMLFLISPLKKLIIYENGFLQTIQLPDWRKGYIPLLVDSKDHLWAVHTTDSVRYFELDLNGNLLHTIALTGQAESFHQKYGEKVVIPFLFNGKAAIGEAADDALIEHRFPNWVSKSYSEGIVFTDELILALDSVKWSVYSSLADTTPKVQIETENEARGLSDYRYFWVDTRGGVWLYGAWGITRIHVQRSRFEKFMHEAPLHDIFPTSAFRGILAFDSIIYGNIPYQGHVVFKKGNAEPVRVIDEGYHGRPLLKSRNGRVLSGGVNELFVLNKGLADRIYSNPDLGSVWALYEDKRGLWIGSDNGLWLMKNATECVNILSFAEKPNNLVYQILPSDENNLLLATENGIYQYNVAEQNAQVFNQKQAGQQFLPVSTCYFIHPDEDGSFWVASASGLIHWNPDNGQSVSYTVLDGLPTDVLYTIFEDDHGYLWISSDNGLIRFHKATQHVRVFFEEDGLACNEFNRISGYQKKDGTIYMGGINGFVRFHPDDFIVENETPPNLFITNFKQYDASIGEVVNRTGDVRSSDRVLLKPGDNYFELQFAISEAAISDNTFYQWRIKELNGPWNSQKENIVRITGLSFGTYHLEIKGLSSDGIWSSPRQIEVVVLPPFYLRTWFLTLLAAAVVLGIVLLFRWRTYVLKKRQQQLETEISSATQQILEDKRIIEKQTEELTKLDQAKSRFFANVTHELRTPIALVLGPVGSVLKSGKLAKQDKKHLLTAQKNSKELLKLVNSLLDLSKMESGKMMVHEEPLQLFAFSRLVASNFESLAGHSQIKYVFEYNADKGLQLLCDKNKLETILNNLISNAIKYSPSKSKVHIQINDLGNCVSFIVRDTGRGIHQNDLPKIFDRFYQSQQTDAPTEGGTGIGLALSKEFARLLGGKLTVTSVVEKGSSFTLEIPRKEVIGVSAAPAEPIETQEAVSYTEEVEDTAISKDRKTILVVEDNHSLRSYLSSILSQHYNIHTASNGKQALAALQRLADRLPDLILSDIMMPEMDGYQLLEALKKHGTYWNIPVIMLTARAALEDRLKALRIGVDDYLFKPFEEEELQARISNLLKHAEGRRQDKDTALDAVPDENQRWLEKLEGLVNANLAEQFTVGQLTRDMGMSESALLKRIKALTGLSSSAYIREYRLNKARQLLENKKVQNVKQAAYNVGFKDPKAFSRSFKQRFGKSPSQYVS